MIYGMLIGSFIFTAFLQCLKIPMHIADVVAGLRLPGLVIMIIIIAIYFALGTFFPEMAMIILTLPVFFPIVMKCGFYPICRDSRNLGRGDRRYNTAGGHGNLRNGRHSQRGASHHHPQGIDALHIHGISLCSFAHWFSSNGHMAAQSHALSGALLDREGNGCKKSIPMEMED